MIKNYLLTGDTHGQVMERLSDIEENKWQPAETALVILGDAGINFYLNKTDRKKKEKLQKSGFHIYVVRGNHEARPQSLPDIKEMWDEEVNGNVWYEENYPNIRYFKDWGDYVIQGYRCLIIGGAFSVDKWYRLAGRKEDTTSWTGWFKDEQLTQEEMTACRRYVEQTNNQYDFVFSHTCPFSWMPTDLFLNIIDQNKVDNTIEHWLDEIKNKINFGVWCFGHYHQDRMERPHVQQFYHHIETFDDVYNRWCGSSPTIQVEWWLPKSPYYYEGQS